MSGLILPSSYQSRSVIGRGEDVNDITRSVQDGDMTVGWRGDPQMDVYREGSEVKVYGFDAQGERYIAATVNMVDSDWRRTLLTKLRDGDWQRDDFLTNLNEKNAAIQRDADRQANDKIEELADRYVSAKLREQGSRKFF